MDLAAWFGSQDVFSTGEAAHIFGSGSVRWTIKARGEVCAEMQAIQGAKNPQVET
jgi:hypothetical protein